MCGCERSPDVARDVPCPTHAAAALHEGDVQFELVIEQRHRWGGMKWHGNVIERTWYAPLNEWSPCIELCDGWFSWSRARLEKKLRRYVEKRKRQIAWKATAERHVEVVS